MPDLPLPALSSAAPGDLASLAREAEAVLGIHSLGCWFPRCIDLRRGGFREDFNADWSPGDDGPRSVVFQARMTWVTATVARRRPHARGDYAAWAAHGLACLEDRFWDTCEGGLRFREDRSEETHSYGVAFALFAAAACDRLGAGDAAQAFAAKLFDWWDSCAHDGRAGGYFEALGRAGAPILDRPDRDLTGVPYGSRSANTLVHVLEALTELYLAQGSPRVRERLEESVSLLDTLLARDRSRLFNIYDRDWQPVDRKTSFGHDIEAAYLDARARRCLGWRPSPRSRALADRALRRGSDMRFGGLYLERRPWQLRASQQKVWWVQAETLNTLIDLHETHHATTDRYREQLLRHWRFVRTHQLDHARGGWLAEVSRDGLRVHNPRKGYAWKACYHEVRALLNLADGARRACPTRSGRLS